MPVSRWLDRLLPFLARRPRSAAVLRADLLAGLAVGLILIPQSMAYAQLAGMPAYFGLYAAFVPVLVGALWGSSAQLATGPAAIIALLTATALTPLAPAGSDEYVALAILLTLLVGLIQLALAALRLGTLVQLISHPVIVGFTNAAALIIVLSQLHKLLGVPMSRSEHYFSDLWGVLSRMDETHGPTLALGLGTVALMLALKRWRPRWPSVLIAVALATGLSWAINFERTLSVSLAQFDSTEMRQNIAQWQQERTRSERVAASLRDWQVESRQIGQGGDALIRARIDYELAVLVAEAEEVARTQQTRFERLREIRFVTETTPSGQIWLRTAAEERDAVWRIQRIDLDRIHLSGGGEVVGFIPPGLPSLHWPQIDWSRLLQLLPIALVIALMGFLESISIAKAMATKTRERLDPNQELWGQGLANLTGSFSQSFPVSGSFGRSAVNLSAGARTPFSSVVSASLVVLTLLFFTPWLYHLPQAALAAVIMLAVLNLIDLAALREAWRVHPHDGAAATLAFVATLAFAPQLELGILLGALLAIVLFVLRRMRPRAVIVGQHPSGSLRGIDEHGLEPISPHFVTIRFDGALVFMNVACFEDSVLEALARFPNARAILLLASGINEIDASGVDKLKELALRLSDAGVLLHVSGLKKQVLEVFARAGMEAAIPTERQFETHAQAITKLKKLHEPVGPHKDRFEV